MENEMIPGSADDFASGVEDPQQQQTPQQQAPQQQPNDDWRSAIGDLAKTVQQLHTPQQQHREPTEEEKNEFWAVYNPTKSDPEFFRKFLRLNTDMDPAEVEKAVKEFQPLFGHMQQGLVRQAVVGARNLFMQELTKLREEFSPISQHVHQQRAEQTRNRFFEQYPALAAKTDGGLLQFAKLIDATARTLADKNFDSEESYFKALAESAAETIRGVMPTFDLGAKPNKPTATTPRLPRTSVGGTGGTGGGSVQSQKKSDDDSDSIMW